MAEPTDELALLNKLIKLGAAAAQESAKANSDDGMAGSIAQGRFYELRYQMRALLAEQARTQTHKAEDAPSDDELKDLAHSAYEEAMSFGLSVDTFLRYFKGIRKRAAAPKGTT